jgi:hypothetical protein
LAPGVEGLEPARLSRLDGRAAGRVAWKADPRLNLPIDEPNAILVGPLESAHKVDINRPAILVLFVQITPRPLALLDVRIRIELR